MAKFVQNWQKRLFSMTEGLGIESLWKKWIHEKNFNLSPQAIFDDFWQGWQ